MSLTLVCPHDREPLNESAEGVSCPSCGRDFPLHDGVLCTLERPDKFYEGAYTSTTRFVPKGERFWQVWPLWLVNSGYVWTVRRHVPKDSTVVELGCACGVRYFGNRYEMVGCDLSYTSLKSLNCYQHRIQADAAGYIPLGDNSVDAVISSYFWEHISPDLKPKMAVEIKRVLRPKGKLVFLYDVETQSPLIRRVKEKDPADYERLFLEGDGHVGYQTPSQNLQIFKDAGFRIVEHAGMEKTWFQSPSVYTKLAQFDNGPRTLFEFASRFGSPPFFYPYTLLNRVIDSFICPWLPEALARIDRVVCEKPADSQSEIGGRAIRP